MLNRPANKFIASTCFVVFCMWIIGDACSATEKLSSGTNSRQAKKQAIQAIPYSQLNADTRTKISTVVNSPSIYRRLPVTAINVDPDMFLFLVRYPEVVVNIWQLMGVTQMTVDRTGPFTMKSNDGAGAISDVELVYGTHNKNIYYAEGTYSGPLLKRKLKGRAVMILNTNYERDANGKPRTVNSLDVFVKVENATASLIAKTLNPIVGPTADHNFTESMKFVQRLNETTEQNGIGVQRMAQRLSSVEENVRDNFARIAGTVYERSARKPTVRNAAAPDQNQSTQAIPAYAPPSQYTKNRFGILQTGFREIKSVFSR
ncbi:MAG: hypothetical protein AAGA30_01850 [Planctomycetota bacterium]